MPVTFECRSCGAMLEVDEELAGRPVACGNCQSEQPVPGPAPARSSVPVVRPISPDFVARPEESDPAPFARGGLSPVGRIALVVAVMVGLLAAGAVAFTVSNPSGTTRLSPEGAGFEVQMPGRLNPTPRTKAIDNRGIPISVTSYVSERKTIWRVVESAEVSYADLAVAPDKDTLPTVLGIFANSLRQKDGHVEMERRTGTLGGRPSVAVLFNVHSQDRVVYQLTIRDRRLFVLAIAGKGYSIDHVRVKRFFASFQFTAE